MRRVILILIIFSAGMSCDTSETISLRFENFFVKYYGGSGDQIAADVARTSDGGYIMVGTNDPDRSLSSLGDGSIGAADEDIILVKTDSLGNEQWSVLIDNNGNRDFGMSVLPTPNGYLVVGNSGVNGIYFESDLNGVPGIITEVDNSGVEKFENVTEISNGYLIAGNTTNPINPSASDNRDYLTIRLNLDLSLDQDWNNQVTGRDGNDYGIKAFQAFDPQDTSIAVFGYTDDPSDDKSIWDLNTFSSSEFDGSIEGNDTFFGDTFNQICEDVAQVQGEFLMVGTYEGNEMYYVHTQGFSQELQALSIFTELNMELEGKSIAPSTDNRVLVLGNVTYVNGDQDIFLGKTNLDGSSQWHETFGSSGQDEAAKVIQNPDGSIVFLGTMNLSGQRKMALIKTNSSGQLKL